MYKKNILNVYKNYYFIVLTLELKKKKHYFCNVETLQDAMLTFFFNVKTIQETMLS